MISQTNFIRNTIFQIENGKQYSIEVDEITKMKELKKILSYAAHLIKNSFQIYHNDIDYTNNYDDQSLFELFPKKQTIFFNLIINDIQEEEISLKVNNNLTCMNHPEKFLVFYCFTCQKSICKICLDLNHQEHDIKEKYDYLAPSSFLINKIFHDSILLLVDEKYDSTNLANDLKKKVKTVLFTQLYQMLNKIELNINDFINFYIDNILIAKKNANENIDLLKNYSIEAYKALKNSIFTQNIIIDENVFLILDRKLKEIEESKESLKENSKKYILMNNFINDIKGLIEIIYNDIFLSLEKYLNINAINEIKLKIKNCQIPKVDKSSVMEKMFKDINIKGRNMIKSISYNSSEINNNSMIESQNNEKIHLFNNNKNNIEEVNNENNNFDNQTLNSNNNSSTNINLNSELSQHNSFMDNTFGNNYNSINKQFNNSNFNSNNVNYYNNNDKFSFNFNNENNLQNSNQSSLNYQYSHIQNKNMDLNNDDNNNIQNSIFSKITETRIIHNNSKEKNDIYNNGIFEKKITVSNNPSQIYYNLNIINQSNLNNSPKKGIEIEEDNSIESDNNNNNNNNGCNNQNITQNQFMTNESINEVTNFENETNNKELNIPKNKIINFYFNNDIKIYTNNKSEKNIQKYSQYTQIKKIQNEILYPIPNTNKIIIQTLDNLQNGKLKEKTVEFPITLELNEFLEDNSFCNYKNKIYISGGIYKNNLTTYFIKYDPSYKTVINMSPMNIKKAKHSMIGYDDKIYSIGGINNNKCEYYDIKEMKWEKLPNLIVSDRQNPLLYIYNNFLYVFGGVSKENSVLSTIERINLRNQKSKWELVPYTNLDNLKITLFGCGIIPFSDKSILLIGGNNKKETLKRIIRFNFYNSSFQKIDYYLDSPVCFKESNLIQLCNNKFGGISEDEEHNGIIFNF